jgi:hypothetical protein
VKQAWLPLLLFVGAAVLVPASAGAAGNEPSLTIGPTSGLPGTTIHVRGSGCPDASWDTTLTWRVRVQTQQPDTTPSSGSVTQPSGTPTTPITFPLVGYTGLAEATVAPASDGTWSTDITIPTTGDFAAPPGFYAIGALCYADEGIEAGTIEYAAQTFELVGDDPLPPPRPLVTNPTFTG